MKNKHPNRKILIGFLINSIITVFILFTVNTEIALDMQLHDTYLVIGVFDLLAFILQFSFIYLLFYVILYFSNRKVNHKIAKTHYYLTTFTALFLSIFLILFTSQSFPKRYFSHQEYEPIFSLLHFFIIPLVIYLIIQFVFFSILFLQQKK